MLSLHFLFQLVMFQCDLPRVISHRQKLSLLESMFYLLYVSPRTLFNWISRDVWTWLWQASSGVTSSYDVLLDLLDRIGNFLKRLDIYTDIPPTQMMTDIIVKIMAELLSVLGLATKLIKQGRLCKCTGAYSPLVAQCVTAMFTKKLLGENDVEAVLQRLDRLTQEEAWMTAAQTLGVVHRLETNMRVAIEGVWCPFCCR